MSFLVSLDSNKRSNQSDSTDDFITTFLPNLQLYRKEGHAWMVALHKATLNYSWYNLSAPLYQNTVLEVSDDGVNYYPITIPDGIYNYIQLSNRIQSLITSNVNLGLGSSVSLQANFSQLRLGVFITPGSGYFVRFDPVLTNPNGSNFYKLLGFDFAQAAATMITPINDASGVVEGVNPGNITFDVSNIYLTCSLVRGSYLGGQLSKTLYSFIPNSPPGSYLEVVPNVPVYVPIEDSNGNIREIRMAIVDNFGRRVDLNGEASQYLLHFQLLPV